MQNQMTYHQVQIHAIVLIANFTLDREAYRIILNDFIQQVMAFYYASIWNRCLKKRFKIHTIDFRVESICVLKKCGFSLNQDLYAFHRALITGDDTITFTSSKNHNYT